MRMDFSRLGARFKQLAVPRQRRRPWAVVDLQPRQLIAVLVAPARGGQRPLVQQAASLAFDGELPPPDRLAALARELRAAGQRWALLLPREEYRLSVMPEPEVPAAELAQSLRWQLAATLDFPVEDAAIDFMKIPTRAWEPERTPDIYAVAARGAAVQAQAALFRNARLALQAIDIRETAQRNIAALLERQGELLAMIAFGRDDVQISFSWQRELYMDRLIAEHVSADDTPERRAAACERIQLQLQRSLDAVRASYLFMQSVRIVVAGAPEGFVEQLKSTVFDPVEELVPDTLFDLSRVPALQDPQVFMQHFHALGVALRDSEGSA